MFSPHCRPHRVCSFLSSSRVIVRKIKHCSVDFIRFMFGYICHKRLLCILFISNAVGLGYHLLRAY